jgi:hypothetical protein
MSEAYTATKTRSGRPGWSVIFRHPLRRDTRGKPGLKIRRGLDTQSDSEADALVAQINVLLSDRRWWSADRRVEAEREFNPLIVSAFFDGMEVGKVDSAQLRSSKISLPGREDGYARVQLVGMTGTGKTTLLRHLIGTGHKEDRFPSTSTAKTTIADIEIITADGAFDAAVTFMTEFEVRAHLDECIEAACLAVVEGEEDDAVADALLIHREERFRLSYLLGSWTKKLPVAEDDFDFEDSSKVAANDLDEEEVVSGEERTANRERLGNYIERVKSLAASVATGVASDLGSLGGQKTPDDRAAWLELFGDALFESEDFARLSLDIKDDVEGRFNNIGVGTLDRSASGWPIMWSLTSEDRGAFLRHVRWFSSNHYQQFGRLLTPLVDGVRVRGPFAPAHKELQLPKKLVLFDGQGLGHTADSVASVSTRITRRFPDVDLILLVDSAQHPMQAAPIALLRAVASAGYASNLAVAYTHFDQVKGDNFQTVDQKRGHLRNSVTNAVSSLRQILGAPVAAALEHRLREQIFLLGGLDREITEIPAGIIREMQRLFDLMQDSAVPDAPTETGPIYSASGLELALRDAVDAFLRPWEARLGMAYRDGIRKEHWTRVKALCRRIGSMGGNEYDTLMPVSDLIRSLQEEISRWLSNPSGWTREPADTDEQFAALELVRQAVFMGLHNVAEQRLTEDHREDWQKAYSFAGRGSGQQRSEEILGIYEHAAPPISSAMNAHARVFLEEVLAIVRDSVERAGGKFGLALAA